MNRKFLDQAAFRELARAGRRSAAPVATAARVASVAADGSRIVRFCYSDGTVDRMGDVISPAGWLTQTYMKNPVVLWAHLSDEPPIARTLNLRVSNGQLIGDIEFPPAGTYAFSDDVFKLMQNGFIHAGSVGFLPMEYQFSDDRPGGIDFFKQELLEFSIVPVPANANALIQARAKGLNTAPLWGSRSGGGSHRVAARLRRWAQEAARAGYRQRGPSMELTEEDLAAAAKHLARERLREAADTSTPEGRAHYARRLRAFYAANGGRLVDPRAAEAEAVYRLAPRW